jgi:hypothetical protein
MLEKTRYRQACGAHVQCDHSIEPAPVFVSVPVFAADIVRLTGIGTNSLEEDMSFARLFTAAEGRLLATALFEAADIVDGVS